MKLNTKLAKRLAKKWHSEAIRRIMCQDLERQELRAFYLNTRVDVQVPAGVSCEAWRDVQFCAEAGEAWAVDLMSEFDASF
jgi:hypothetical protein